MNPGAGCPWVGSGRRAEVGVREFLEEFGGASLGVAGGAVDDEVSSQAHGVVLGRGSSPGDGSAAGDTPGHVCGIAAVHDGSAA
jgi:hypothetical protein